MCPILELIQTLKEYLCCHILALMCGRMWTQLSQPLAQFVIGSPGTPTPPALARNADVHVLHVFRRRYRYVRQDISGTGLLFSLLHMLG